MQMAAVAAFPAAAAAAVMGLQAGWGLCLACSGLTPQTGQARAAQDWAVSCRVAGWPADQRISAWSWAGAAQLTCCLLGSPARWPAA